ncbi:hypothetical protein MNV49_001865 [Pseudohyphozyma bogoriensis]|nr:hypothetical protein MNV49_001865 [Pseudohyphozyma bogoriensis]
MSNRVRHGAEDEATAYRLQVLGAREGAIKGTLVAGTLVALAHWRFPLVRRQTLAGKAFLTMWGTIFGMVTHADHYLLEWEEQHRRASEKWRNQARAEMAGQGLIPTETSMRQWKAKKDAELEAQRLAASQNLAATSPVLQELGKVQQEN